MSVDGCLTPEECSRAAGSALFRSCPAETVRRALSDSACTLESTPAGGTIYEPQRFRRCLGLLLSGTARVTRGELAMEVLGPGELFGAAALYNREPDYPATLTACAPCRSALLPQELLGRLMDEDARIRDNYICYLSGRIRFLSGRVQALSAGDAAGRLARYLRGAAEQGRLDCPAAELARRLGLSRASLYRAFGALEERGLIRREGKEITVPDREALARF